MPRRRDRDRPRRARGGDRARGREPRTAQAHDGARDYAWARASAVESRRGGERDEAHRGADGGRDGDVHHTHVDCHPGDLLLVAARARGGGTVIDSALDTRAVLLRRGAALEVLTVGYNAVEGLVAIGPERASWGSCSWRSH